MIDEILAGYGVSKRCIDKMLGFKKGATMVFVSHSMSNVEMICDRVMEIDNHIIKMVGEIGKVVEGYLKCSG